MVIKRDTNRKKEMVTTCATSDGIGGTDTVVMLEFKEKR
jgi:hypothetical protein